LPFTNAQDLLELCEDHNLSIAQVVFKNELRWKSAQEVRHGLLKIWKVMDECIDNGIKNPQNQKYLPGNLDVKRRAPSLHRNLMQK
jgi:L-serine dehydratase